MGVNRRDFLRGFSVAALGFGVSDEAYSQATAVDTRWDAGGLRHILPTVSDTRMLIKASFNAPLADTPVLRVGSQNVRGRMGDTRGEHWHFYATGLQPGRRYTLALVGDNGRALSQPWELSTFPGPDERPERFRVLFFTCAGGHEALEHLPNIVRSRLLRRALSFQPDAAVANGDHIYWDQLAPFAGRTGRRKLKSSPASSTGQTLFSAATTEPYSSISVTPRSPRYTRPIFVRRPCSSFRMITTILTMTMQTIIS